MSVIRSSGIKVGLIAGAITVFISVGTGYAAAESVGEAAAAMPSDSARTADSGGMSRPLCVFVNSYHQGYAWSDGVERGLRSGLGSACHIHQIDMDTKRIKGSKMRAEAGMAAAMAIDSLKPDIVITADDNAAKYLIVPYLKDSDIPVVFSGINWTVEEYGFPLPNVTGIVEVAPIRPMLKSALRLVGPSSRVAYIGALTLTEIKNHDRIARAGKALGLEIDSMLVESFDMWKQAFLIAQNYDFVVVGSYSGISDWDHEKSRAFAAENTRRLSLTNHDWMMGQSSVGFTKIPEEHGEWAAASAIAILNGTPASNIPLVTNRKWDAWINEDLVSMTGVTLDKTLLMKAKRAQAW